MEILKLGSKGESVKQLQMELVARQYGLVLDGVFGPKTEVAVRAFQTSMDLVSDGIVGPNTWNAILYGRDVEPIQSELDTLQKIDKAFRKGTLEWYEAAFAICKIDERWKSSVRTAANKALQLEDDYRWGEKNTGVPWDMLLCIHLLECNNHPKGVLHNGQLIVGTGRKTTIVPAGRGPFATFRDSIVDAVKLQGLLNSVKPSSWSLGMKLKQCELFNGAGYLKYHPSENSPYLWSRTNINDGTGKYVSDGKWSDSADADAQVGVASMLITLKEMGKV